MRFLKLFANYHGRDFIIGDIHGCYRALMALLDSVKFDPLVDRLFSVGDLIDRGPDSEKCLQLIFEPWFFMVKGNHESIFCDAVNNVTTFMHRTDYFKESYGGAWTKSWFKRNAPELAFWEKKLAPLPYVIHVQPGDNVSGFWVVHAELRAPEQRLSENAVESYVNNVCEKELAILQWGRKIAKRKPVTNVPQFSGPIYCGHTPTRNAPEIVHGHWNLDGGAGKWKGPGAFSDVALVMVCHQTGEVHSIDVSGDVYNPSK